MKSCFGKELLLLGSGEEICTPVACCQQQLIGTGKTCTLPLNTIQNYFVFLMAFGEDCAVGEDIWIDPYILW